MNGFQWDWPIMNRGPLKMTKAARLFLPDCSKHQHQEQDQPHIVNSVRPALVGLPSQQWTQFSEMQGVGDTLLSVSRPDSTLTGWRRRTALQARYSPLCGTAVQRARLGSASWARRGETDAGERIREKENASTGGNLPPSMQTAHPSQTARETLGVIIRVAVSLFC